MRLHNFIYFLIIALAISCRSESIVRPTHNQGGYTISVTPNNGGSEVTVSGRVREIHNKNPIKHGWITMGCEKYPVDSLGLYQFKTTAVDGFYLSAISIGYREVETEHFKTEKGDSITIDFLLAQDDRPLINCEGR